MTRSRHNFVLFLIWAVAVALLYAIAGPSPAHGQSYATATTTGARGTKAYAYRVSAVVSGSQAAQLDIGVTNGAATLSDVNAIALAWPALTGADLYAVYRNGTPTGQPTGYYLVATTASNTWTDHGDPYLSFQSLAYAAHNGKASAWQISAGTSSPTTPTGGERPGTGTGSVTSVNASGGSTGLTFSGGPITSTGTLTLGGVLAAAYGGTGATSPSTARAALGLAIGTNIPATNGAGATGTWPINISGTATTASGLTLAGGSAGKVLGWTTGGVGAWTSPTGGSVSGNYAVLDAATNLFAGRLGIGGVVPAYALHVAPTTASAMQTAMFTDAAPQGRTGVVIKAGAANTSGDALLSVLSNTGAVLASIKADGTITGNVALAAIAGSAATLMETGGQSLWWDNAHTTWKFTAGSLYVPAGITAYSSVTAPSFMGALTGDVTGNLTGNLTGNVTGDVTGNLNGSAASALSLSVMGRGLIWDNPHNQWKFTAGSLYVPSGINATSDITAPNFVGNLTGVADTAHGLTIAGGTEGQVLTSDASGVGSWQAATGGSGGGAPTDAKYITQTANSGLSAEQSLGSLTTGLLKNTVTAGTGVLSTATASDIPDLSATYLARHGTADAATMAQGLTLAGGSTGKVLGWTTGGVGAWADPPAGGSAPANMVTTVTDQTISGYKTLTGGLRRFGTPWASFTASRPAGDASVTRTAGYQFTGSEVGQYLVWADGEVNVVRMYLGQNLVYTEETTAKASQTATIVPAIFNTTTDYGGTLSLGTARTPWNGGVGYVSGFKVDLSNSSNGIDGMVRWGRPFTNSGTVSGLLGYNEADSTSATVKVGAANADLSFWIDGVQRMRINKTTGNVGIGTPTPAASALLDISSTTKGFLPPRMDTTARTAIVSPAEGLTVYDLTLHKLYCYDGTTWQAAW